MSREIRARIRMIKGLSAHADEEDLFSIFRYEERKAKFGVRQSRSKVVLIHGDHQAATLSYKLKLGRRK